ncbi:MAG TPA: response regulator, partial [Candidatus Nitrosotenuis sp.]|nr:response regulator [Candidatus Nitrosotenuis sp.]
MSKTILVADDEPYVLRSIEYILKKEGFRVLTAVDGEEALAKIRSENPDLVFLDIQMPRMDGNTVCRTLRQDGLSD